MSYVLVLHNGDMSGDCEEMELEVNDYKGLTMNKIVKDLLTPELLCRELLGMNARETKKALKDPDHFIHEEIKMYKDTKLWKGAWVLDIKTHQKLTDGLKYAEEPGNDSSAYAMQALIKGMSRSFAVATIGKQAKG